MEYVGLWLLCSLASAVIASAKGRSSVGWFVLGLLIGPFAVIIGACLPTRRMLSYLVLDQHGAVIGRHVPIDPRGYTNADSRRLLAVIICVPVLMGVVMMIINTIGG